MLCITLASNFVIALLAFVEQPSYTVEEEVGSIEVCVVLEGMLEAEIVVNFFTINESATGIPIDIQSFLWG